MAGVLFGTAHNVCEQCSSDVLRIACRLLCWVMQHLKACKQHIGLCKLQFQSRQHKVEWLLRWIGRSCKHAGVHTRPCNSKLVTPTMHILCQIKGAEQCRHASNSCIGAVFACSKRDLDLAPLSLAYDKQQASQTPKARQVICGVFAQFTQVLSCKRR